MKKLVVLLAFTLVTVSATFAGTGFYVGLNTGINNVSLNKVDPLWSKYGSSKDKISTVSARYAPTIGIQVGYQFVPKFGIQTGVSSLRQGHHYQDSTYEKGSLDALYTADYVHIPLLFRFTTGRDGSGFFLEAGPHINFLQSATLKESGTVVNETTDVSGKVQAKDLGLSFGLGISFQANSMFGFCFGFKGIYSLQNINKNVVNGYSAPKLTNSALGINIGVNYHF